MDKRYAIGIDLGGTKIEIGIVDEEGLLLKTVRLQTDKEGGPDAILDQIVQGVKELRKEENIPVVAAGMGVPGQVDAKTGLIYFAPNLGWRHVQIKEKLTKALEMPIHILDDVRAATWGEWKFGSGKDCDDIVCVFVGTGIGGGIVSGGKLLTGGSNTCGEVGHMVIDFHGPYCTCGGRGCFEAHAGGWAIAKRAQESIKSYGEAGASLLRMAGGKIENVTAKTVVDAEAVHDSLAELIMEHFKQALIAGCVGLVNVLNPSRLILGGGIIEGSPHTLPYVEVGIKQRALAAATQGLEVLPAKLGGQAGVIGAATIVIERA